MQNMDDSNWQNSKGQGVGGVYDQTRQAGQETMGGGHGSGVAGGPKGSEQKQSTQSSGQKNWPEHGTEAVGQKAGMNMSDQNAASASTFIDEETPEYCEGHGLPGV
ncbi:hypothetical protein SCP_0604490 [Sparassis crispa]|uniref:Uncharacterized protein n=1 Tax=Sparassis crispa TaxID=139825 RepID=A0A401GQN4_9APHY|nr:hypothetical protein SCP_0604490 [Sparassis crispa]GBE84470.1 hypothetical protein SCP_0604490 [Sparassis crispa]